MKTFRSLSTALRARRAAVARLDRFTRYLHRIARANACKGDLFVGWDRSTLRLCRPDDFARLVALESDVARLTAWVRWFVPVAPAPLCFA